MRRYAPVLAVSLCAGLVGCNGGGTPAGQPTPSPTSPSPTTPATLTRAQLDATLLTAADMGSGWSGTAPEDATTDDDPSLPPTPSPCDLDAMYSRLPDPLYGREVGLTNLSTTSFVAHEVDVLESGDAAKGFADVTATLARCQTLTTVDEESRETTTLRQAPLNAGPFGDQTVAVSLTEPSPGPDGEPFAAALVIFRRGDIVVSVTGFGPSDPSAAVALAATKAFGKLETVLAGATPALPAS